MARVQLAVFAGVFVLATLGAPTRASENGGYYTCLPLTDDYCVFKKSENAPSSWGDLGPHPVDPSMAEDLHRMLVNGQGNQLPPSPKPWTEGDAEVSSTAEVNGDDWMWTLAAEIGFPLRNAVMYTPSDITATGTGPLSWAALTRAINDCHIKQEDEEFTQGDRTMTAYSVDNVWTIVQNPADNDVYDGCPQNCGDVHNQLLMFLEEGIVDLACLMVPASNLISMERCVHIREEWNLSEGEASDCWVAGYEEIWGRVPDTGTQELTSSNFTQGGGTGSGSGNAAAAPTSLLLAAAALAVAAAVFRQQ